jgi:hypothetical protein
MQQKRKASWVFERPLSNGDFATSWRAVDKVELAENHGK